MLFMIMILPDESDEPPPDLGGGLVVAPLLMLLLPYAPDASGLSGSGPCWGLRSFGSPCALSESSSPPGVRPPPSLIARRSSSAKAELTLDTKPPSNQDLPPDLEGS